MLKARFEYLGGICENFVIVESDRDHSNRPRELDFPRFLHEEAEFIDRLNLRGKLHFVPVRDLPSGENNWPRVWWQRNAISRALQNDYHTIADPIKKDDFLLISDIDEFPDAEVLKELKKGDDGLGKQVCDLLTSGNQQPAVVHFSVKMYYYDLWHVTTNPWIGTRLCTVADALHVSPEVVRRWPLPVGRLDKAGWHLSYFGGIEAIKKKMESIAESTWTAHPYYTDTESIEARIKASKDLYERDGECWEYQNPLGVPAVLLKYFPSPLFPKVEEGAAVEAQIPAETPASPIEARLTKLPGINGYADMSPYGDLLTQLVKDSANGTVLELGTFNGVSTTYFLKGLIEWSETHAEKMPLLVCCDVQKTPDVDELRYIAGASGIPFVFERGSSLELVPKHFLLKGETFDVVLLDTWHNAEQVRGELAIVAPYAKRLVFHDTELFGFTGNDSSPGILPAIWEFLLENRQWEVELHRKDGVGMTVLKLKGVE